MNRLPEIRALLVEITAGPWTRVGRPGQDGAILIVSEGRRNGKAPLVAMVDARREEAGGNADLIARAPELLAWAADEIERLRDTP